MKNNLLYLFFGVSLIFASCESVLQVTPRASVDSSELITDANSAAVAVNGMYDQIQDDDIFGLHYMMIPDLLSDNTFHSGTFTSYREMDENDILADNVDVNSTWFEMYEAIYRANLIIDLLPGVNDAALDPLKGQYDGEAKFLRAVMYFQLVRLFGDVPLVLAPTKDLNSIEVPRNAAAEVLAQIVSDLQDAVGSLPESGDRTKASKGAANAYLAKVHLWMGNNAGAISAADAVMADATGYALETDYANIFGGGSDESIFQASFNSTDANSTSFWFWDKPAGRHEFAPTDEVMAAYETGDVRAAASFATAVGGGGGTHYVTKYSDFATGTDQPIGIRLADVMLIKAEAAAASGDLTTAETLVNQIRARAGLGGVTLTAGNYEDMILQERRVELAFEGDRWFDLRRTGRAEAFLQGKGRAACMQLLPIPQDDMDTNPALVQNDCY